MKILLAVHHFPPTRTAGAEQFAYRIASGLIERGHSVQVVCVESIDDQQGSGVLRWSDEQYRGIPVRRLYSDQGSSEEPRRTSFDNPSIEANLADWIGENRPDLVHLVSGYLMGIAPIRAASRFRIPTVVTLNDFWFICPTIYLLRGDGSLCGGPSGIECARCLFDAKRRFRLIDQRAPQLMKAFWRLASRHPKIGERFGLPERLDVLAQRRVLLIDTLNTVDLIVPITHFLADLYIRNGVHSDRLVVMPLGVSPVAPFTRQVDPTVIHFGYLGQIAPIKGIDILVRAFRKLDRSRLRARLIIHGRMAASPGYSQRLKQLAENDPDIVFAGEYENSRVMEILSDLDLIVVPSIWYENSPTVLLEAFSAGRPVIGTNVGGISEIVQNDINGLSFERGSVEDLKRKMERVLHESTLLGRLARGIPRLKTPDEEIEGYMTHYRRLLSTQSHAPLTSSETPANSI